MKTLFALFTLLMTTSACTHLVTQLVKPPTVQSSRLEVEEASLRDVRMKVHLDIANPNSFDLPVNALKAELQVDGAEPLTMTWDQLPTLASGRTTPLALPVRLEWRNALEIAQRLIVNPVLPYTLKGTASVQGLDIPFQEKGEFNLRETR